MATSHTCKLIRLQDTYNGKQGFTYFHGISAESTGAEGLCMHLVTVPPGGHTKVHLHAAHETAIYIISGEAENWFGDQLEEQVTTRTGDLFYIPAGVPHVTVNTSDEPATAVIARTDPNEQESVVLLPELEAVFDAKTKQ